ncbi:MAG: chloride channel protein [Parvibaculum sp.]|nr:chloride channel protein [Parvibaculum sp.]
MPNTPETKEETYRKVNLVGLSFLALAVGLFTGLGAVAFRSLVSLVHNIFFLGEFSFAYDSNRLTEPGPWGAFFILAPVIGGMGVVYLVKNYAPEARGHGVPEVMDAIYHKEGRVRPIVAVIKSLASALSIGSGASVGREGPIVQIGAALGSSFATLINLTTWQRITLLAAGAGAGIAATFNTPLGGVLFTLELMLPEVSPRTFLPVVIATGSAAYVGRLFFGLQPAFLVALTPVPSEQTVDVVNLLAFVALGLLCGAASWGFIRTLVFCEEFFPKRFANEYLRNAVGMSIVGLMGYLFVVTSGHYYVNGVGYGTIQAILQGHITSIALLALLCGAKVIATSVSLGSGASGGVFAPSLYIGATLGGAFGAVMLFFWPGHSVSVAEYAMVGMAAVVGGGTGATMTAITMVFEMTRDYNIIIPLIMAVAIAVGVRRALMSENIYTIKLVRRGRRIPKDLYSNAYLVRIAHEVMDSSISIMSVDTPVEQALIYVAEGAGVHFILLQDGERIAGVVPFDNRIAMRDTHGEQPVTVRDLAITDYVLVRENNILEDVMRRIRERNATLALVVRDKPGIPRPGDVLGVIGKPQIADIMLKTQIG